MKQVKPKKQLGQHFLTDLSIARRIADTVDACPDIPVLEIGPGMGVLTQYLITKPRQVCAVEIDRESIDYLREHFPQFASQSVSTPPYGGGVGGEALNGEESGERILFSGDFLRMDLRELFGGRQFVLTGNYPYDISSQIFFKMLDNRDLIPCCTGMIQREVALRMAAQPGSKTYGILSVLIQAWYDVEYLFTVEPSVFNPPPKVQSAVIRMTRNDVTNLGCDEQLFRRIVKTVFNQRRKMLRVSLRQLLSADAIATLQQSLNTPSPIGERSGQLSNLNFLLGQTGRFQSETGKELSTLNSPLDPQGRFHSKAEKELSTLLTLRPEQLSIQQFVDLTNHIAPLITP